MRPETSVLWFVGIDWGHETHQVCVLDATGKLHLERRVRHGARGLVELAHTLRALAAGNPELIAVAIEVPHGPVVETLLEYGLAVYAINPKQLDRFRDRFTVAGAKDDRRDAHVLADSLRTDRRSFRRLALDPAALIELRDWSRLTTELTQERTRLCNRVRAQLVRYFPELLALADDVGAPWVLALLELVPTPAAAATLRRTQIAALLKRYRVRTHDAVAVWATLRTPPMPVSPGTIAGATARLAMLIPRLRLVNEQLTAARARLDALTAPTGDADPQRSEQRVATIVRSLPGVGPIVCGALLGEAWQPLQAADYHALRLLSGAAPITIQSGKWRAVHRRRACNPRLAVALYHGARNAARDDPRLAALYRALRARGHSHGRALRTIADRLLAMLCSMLRADATYDPTRRQAA
jgi:transposase